MFYFLTPLVFTLKFLQDITFPLQAVEIFQQSGGYKLKSCVNSLGIVRISNLDRYNLIATKLCRERPKRET